MAMLLGNPKPKEVPKNKHTTSNIVPCTKAIRMVEIVPKNMDEISSFLRLNLIRKKLPKTDQKIAEQTNKSWLI